MQKSAKDVLLNLSGALPKTIEALAPYLPHSPYDPELKRAS